MKSQYDQFSADFSASRQQSWPEFELLIPTLRKNDRLLDLGCGNGRLRHSLDPEVILPGAYFGFDLSAGLLKIAKENFPDDHFFRGSFGEPLPFGADNFDHIVMIASFHHLLKKSDQIACLREIHRILKPGGKIFLTTWNIPRKFFWKNFTSWDFWLSGWKNHLIPFGTEKHPRHYRMVTDRDLKKLLKKSGFKVNSTQLFRGKNFIVMGEK